MLTLLAVRAAAVALLLVGVALILRGVAELRAVK